MMSEERILFDIKHLYADCVENRLNSISGLKSKIEFLIELVDFYTSQAFDKAEKEIISGYYTDMTAERYEAPYLSSDEKNLIIEYTLIIGSLDKGIDLINQVCDEGTKEIALNKALEVVNINEKQKSRKIINNLIFEDFEEQQIKNKNSHKTLAQRLKEANEQINTT